MGFSHQKIGEELFASLKSGNPIGPLTERYPDVTIDDAYHISLAFLKTRLKKNNESVVGKKIGVTSPAVQNMLGVFQPDFGFLTDAMWSDGKVYMDNHIAPRAEAEIAFKLKSGLKGPGVTGKDVLAATEYVQPCFEIVDSRIQDWKVKIQDTIADNAMAELEVVVEKNGKEVSRGLGSAVQGAPENAVAWLANTLGEYDIPFEAGEIILSGSLVPLEPVQRGDKMLATFAGFGACAVEFV